MIRPNYKKWELTDCFGEYDYRQNVIQVQHDLCGQEMANTICSRDHACSCPGCLGLRSRDYKHL